jgi:hypothetical protein
MAVGVPGKQESLFATGAGSYRCIENQARENNGKGLKNSIPHEGTFFVKAGTRSGTYERVGIMARFNYGLLLRTDALTLCPYGFRSSIYYRNRSMLNR